MDIVVKPNSEHPCLTCLFDEPCSASSGRDMEALQPLLHVSDVEAARAEDHALHSVEVRQARALREAAALHEADLDAGVAEARRHNHWTWRAPGAAPRYGGAPLTFSAAPSVPVAYSFVPSDLAAPSATLSALSPLHPSAPVSDIGLSGTCSSSVVQRGDVHSSRRVSLNTIFFLERYHILPLIFS